MGPIRFSGMSSGLPPDIVERLMDAERIPLQQMELKKAKSENKLKLVDELHSKVSGIQGKVGELVSSRGFTDMQLISGDPSILSGTVDPAQAVTGSWDIEVLELAQKPGAMTNGFPDSDKTEIGVGYFRFYTPDGERDVYINGSSTTLNGAAKAINNANLGVRASVVNDRHDKDYPYRLVLTGLGRGDDNTVEFPTLYLLDGDRDLYFEEERPAKNGRIKLDGFEIEVADNTLKSLIPGATIDLKQTAPGRTVTINVKEDMEVVSGKIDEFVKSVNEVLGFIQSQNNMNEKTDTTQTLGGDSMLRQIENRLRRVLQNPQLGIQGPINRLGQIGIQFKRDGTLEFSKEKFDSTLRSDPKSVQHFLSGDGFATGFVPSLKRELGNILNTAFGPVSNRQRGLRQKIDQVNDRIERKERQLERRQQTLVRQFSKLEETMSRLQANGGAAAALGGMAGGPQQGG